jgi:hypothetical protein
VDLVKPHKVMAIAEQGGVNGQKTTQIVVPANKPADERLRLVDVAGV